MSRARGNVKLRAKRGSGRFGRTLWGLLILIVAMAWAEERTDQYAVMVFPTQCIQVDPKMTVEAPMKGGFPDLENAKVMGTFKVDPKCSTARTEIRKVGK